MRRQLVGARQPKVNFIRKLTKKEIFLGVWLALLPQNNIIVYDIEGVDSRERWEEGEVLKSDTFAIYD